MPESIRPRLTRLADLLEDGLIQATAAYEAHKSGAALGPRIRCSPKLESELCGSLPVGLTILHAPPGCGKTALANQLAADAECPAVIASWEMPPLELLRRHAARVTSTYISKFRTGVLTPSEWLTHMRRTVATMPELAILDATHGGVKPEDLREAVNAVRGNSAHALLVIDSASSWVRSSGRDGMNEYEATSDAISALQSLAAELGIAILVVAEQNRASMGSDRQEAAAGTRAFEYGCEVMLALQRDKDAYVDADGSLEIDLVIAKNRLGAQGRRIPLRFEGGFMRFSESDGFASMNRPRKKSA